MIRKVRTDITITGGGGDVTSVFGRTGAVVAATDDYTWAQINKTVSDIADINVRSHTSLTSIGTNTHAQIDTHIASTSNPHSVTAAQAGAVALTGNESVSGVKTFNSIPVLPNFDPTIANEAVRKSYVDTLLTTGSRFVIAVNAATTAALAACTYNNGASGAGATLTGNANGAFATIDGVAAALNNLYLIKDQASGLENGAYTLTQVGDGGTPFILTRIATYDVAAEIVGGTFFNILSGTVNGNDQWALTTTGSITVGTTALTYSQLSAPVVYSASNGVLLSGLDFQIDLSDTNPSLEVSDGGLRAKVDGTTITRNAGGLAVGTITDSNVSGAIATTHGGTNLTTIGTANQVLGVNNGVTGLEYKSIVGGSNVAVVHTANQVEISSSLTGAADFHYTSATLYSDPGVAFPFTNLAAALTTGSAFLRVKVNLTGADQFRLVVNQGVAGFAGSKLRMQYSTNNVTFLDLAATPAAGDLDVGTGTGVKTGSFTPIATDAKQDVWLQIYSLSGDGVVDPSFRQIKIDFRYNTSIVDGSTSSIVNSELTIHSHPNSALIWTNMPAAVTEFLGATTGRYKYDLSGQTHYRLIVNQSVAGFAGSDINLQYSTNNSTFFAADTSAAGELDVGTGTGVKVGAWAPLVDAAKGDVWLRLVGKQGDGIVDPAWRQVAVQFKGAVYAPTAGSDTQVIYNSLGTATGDSDFVYNGTTNVLSVPTLSLTNATQNINLNATGGVFTVQSQDSGEQAAFGVFSKDGDGTDNVFSVWYAKGLPGAATDAETLLIGYILGGPDFQITTGADGTGTLRKLRIYTEGNLGQLDIQTDGSLGLGNILNLDFVEIDADTDAAIFKSTTAANESIFVVGTPTANGTEIASIAMVSKGVDPTAAASRGLLLTANDSNECVIASIGTTTENASPLTIGVSDDNGASNLLLMTRAGATTLNTIFYSNYVTGKNAFGVTDPTDFNIGADIRPLLTLKGSAATLDGNIGFPIRFEANDGEGSANALVATMTGGTRASPTIIPTDVSILSLYPVAWDSSDFILAGQIDWTTTGTPAVGDVKTVLTIGSSGGTITIDENGDLTITNDLVSINGVSYTFPSVAAAGALVRDSGGTVTFEEIPDAYQRVALTGQTASIGGTGFTGLPTASTLISVDYYLLVTTADAGAGSVQVDIGWNDGTASRTTSSASLPLTSTGYLTGNLVILKGSAQSVQYSTVVATIGTAVYALYINVRES